MDIVNIMELIALIIVVFVAWVIYDHNKIVAPVVEQTPEPEIVTEVIVVPVKKPRAKKVDVVEATEPTEDKPKAPRKPKMKIVK
jgi:hypothetical protein